MFADTLDQIEAAVRAAPALSAIAAGGLASALLLVFRIRSIRRSADGLAAELAELREDLAAAEAKAEAADALQAEALAERARREALERDLAVADTRLEERERSVTEMRRRLEDEFQGLAARLLDQSQRSFLERADETFKRHREVAAGDADARRKAVDDLVKPIAETLTRYEKGLEEFRQTTAKREGELMSRIAELATGATAVRDEAQKLTAALRSGPKTRGRWGEEALKNVIEMSGLSQYADFVEQREADDSRRRPDVKIRLPGERFLVIDAKVAFDAYLDSLDAESEEARGACLARHADALRKHALSLASKEYAKDVRGSVDFVVMFVPGDNFFAAAAEVRPGLFQEAFDKGVIIATPTNLIALLKSIAFDWRREKATENAYRIAGMAKDLYESLRKMGLNLSALGKSLETSVRKYNDLVGGVEGRVMPRARRFAELELPGTEDAIDESPPIEQDVREPREGRDLMIAPPRDDEAA